jgi:hypothetical protein
VIVAKPDTRRAIDVGNTAHQGTKVHLGCIALTYGMELDIEDLSALTQHERN